MFSVRGKRGARLERSAGNGQWTAKAGYGGARLPQRLLGRQERMWEATSKSRLLSTSSMTLGKLTFPKAHFSSPNGHDCTFSELARGANMRQRGKGPACGAVKRASAAFFPKGPWALSHIGAFAHPSPSAYGAPFTWCWGEDEGSRPKVSPGGQSGTRSSDTGTSVQSWARRPIPACPWANRSRL